MAGSAQRRRLKSPNGRIDTRCKLCGADAPLQRSHILPEFIYEPIYDDNHKGRTFHPLAPERSRKIQQGLWEYLLCRACEQFLNDEYEKPFRSLWFERRILAPLETRDHALLRCEDHARFKLFHLSALLRADLSRRPEFSDVQLGEHHRERLRELVLGGNPGRSDEYPIVCKALETPTADRRIWWDLIATAQPGKLQGARFYHFTFGGCDWLYFVCSHRLDEIERASLQPDGTLPVVKGPWAPIEYWRSAWRRGLTSNRPSTRKP